MTQFEQTFVVMDNNANIHSEDIVDPRNSGERLKIVDQMAQSQYQTSSEHPKITGYHQYSSLFS